MQKIYQLFAFLGLFLVSGCGNSSFDVVGDSLYAMKSSHGSYIAYIEYVPGDSSVLPDIITQRDETQRFIVSGRLLCYYNGRLISEKTITSLQAFGNKSDIRWSLIRFDVPSDGIVEIKAEGNIRDVFKNRKISVSRCYL